MFPRALSSEQAEARTKADPLSLPEMDPNPCIHRALTFEGEESSSFT